jgi:undecaprenyl-diphosphatase
VNAPRGVVEPTLNFLAAHPDWVGVAVAVIAFAESLALVGLLVPGAVLMFAAGALVGGSHLPVVPILLWAMAGAIAGDGLSFYLGRRFRGELRRLPVIRRYPGAVNRAEALFHRHGGKSVVMGRFVGPVRPVIPAVVGMLGMPPGRFLLANLGSAVIWAPAYLLPGVVFGASLVLALEVMGRLVAWIVLAIGGFLLLRWGLPRVDRPLRLAGHRLARAVGRHPPGGMAWAWLRPLHAATRALRYRRGWFWWLMLAVLVTTSLRALIEPAAMDWERGIAAVLRVSSAPSREAFWALTQLGGGLAIATAALAFAGVLWWTDGCRRALLALLAVAATQALAYGLKAWVGLARPLSLTETPAFGAALPSAHAAGIAVLVTLWVVLWPATRSISRNLLVAIAALLTTAVAVSRLALGVHWPVDVLAGIGLGVTLGGLPVVARRTRDPGIGPIAAVAVSLVMLLGTAQLTRHLQWPDPVADYPAPPSLPVVAAADWLRGAEALPQRRLAVLGYEAGFDAQWWAAAATPPAGFERGWQPPPDWGWQTLLRWVSPRPTPARLPVLPRWHQGRTAAFVRIRLTDNPTRRWVLRGWPVAHVKDGRVWVVQLEQERITGGLLLPRLDRQRPDRAAVTSLLDAAAARVGWRAIPGARPARYSPAIASWPQGGISD